MKNRQAVNVRVDDAIALCHIIDEFENFNNNFINFLETTKNNSDNIILNLYRLLKGEKIILSSRIKKFYNDNKNIIDAINKYSNIMYFICQNYHIEREPIMLSVGFNSLYQYILENKEEINKILAVLTKIKDLGFAIFEFNPNLDFTENTHFVIKNSSDNLGTLTYLDNLEAVPNYDGSIVEYKSNGSNYLMVLSIIPRKILSFESKIFLNDLTFDANRLPKKLTLEETLNRICLLPNAKRQEYQIVRNSVDMSISIDGLYQVYSKTSSEFSKLEGVESKPALLAELTKIKEAIDTMASLSEQYNKQMIANNEGITETLLTKEKQSYVRRRELQREHLD